MPRTKKYIGVECVCQVCGETFTASKWNAPAAKTCGRNCRQQALRNRHKAMREAIKAVGEDLVIKVTKNERGNMVITWDMSPETEAALTAAAEAQDCDLDELLQDAQQMALVKNKVLGATLVGQKRTTTGGV